MAACGTIVSDHSDTSTPRGPCATCIHTYFCHYVFTAHYLSLLYNWDLKGILNQCFKQIIYASLQMHIYFNYLLNLTALTSLIFKCIWKCVLQYSHVLICYILLDNDCLKTLSIGISTRSVDFTDTNITKTSKVRVPRPISITIMILIVNT